MNAGIPRRMLIESAGAEELSMPVGGVSTSALAAGNGTTLLVLDGLNAAGGLVWWPVFPALSAEYRVVAPDLPGLGKSEALDGRPSPPRVVEWIKGVIEACCDEPAVVVATSLAGGFALGFAAAHPHLLRGLILADAQGLATFRPPPGFVVGTILNSLRPSEARMRRLVRYVIHDQDHVRQIHGPLWDGFLSYMVSQAGRSDIGRALHGYTSRDIARPVSETALLAIDLPVHMIWGQYDRPFPLAIAERSTARFGWPLTIIEDAGHLPYIEQPSKFAEAIGESASSL